MGVFQCELRLAPRPRGFHLVTGEIEAALQAGHGIRTGVAHVFLRHTSASLAINENADPDVPADLETACDRIVPEEADYRHTTEGSDDMPAHVKAVLIGSSLSIPVRGGRLLLGTWQGIYLCEHRDQGGPRSVVITLLGE